VPGFASEQQTRLRPPAHSSSSLASSQSLQRINQGVYGLRSLIGLFPFLLGRFRHVLVSVRNLQIARARQSPT